MAFTRPSNVGTWARPVDPDTPAAATSINPWIEVVSAAAGAGANQVALDSDTPADPLSLVSAMAYSDGFQVDVNKTTTADGFANSGTYKFDFVDGSGAALDIAGGKIGLKFVVDVVTSPGTSPVGVSIGVADTAGDVSDAACIVVGCASHVGYATTIRRGQVYRTSEALSSTTAPTVFEGYYLPGYGKFGETLGGYRKSGGVEAYNVGTPSSLNDANIKGVMCFTSNDSGGGTTTVKYRLYYTWFEIETEPS